VRWAFPRESHHKYLLSDPTMRGYFLNDGNDCIGYAYIAATGNVEPLAVVRRDVMAAAFNGALMIPAEGGSDRISAFLPGNCETAPGVAVYHRMRITLPMVPVCDREFGDWTRYLPRNPGFM
jgi:hypothetical protein